MNPPEGDGVLVRPFLARGPGRSAAREVRADEEIVSAVRPYYLTRGRTNVADSSIGFETVLLITDRGRHRIDRLGYEHRQIVERCDDPISVAELAVGLDLPIGVARVLAADLTVNGLLQTHRAVADPSRDVELLTRLIDGVRAL